MPTTPRRPPPAPLPPVVVYPMLAVLASSGCRVGELVRLRVRDFKTHGEQRILNVTGKGGKERATPLHLEGVERLAAWLAVPGIKDDPAGPLFPAARTPRGQGRNSFKAQPMSQPGSTIRTPRRVPSPVP